MPKLGCLELMHRMFNRAFCLPPRTGRTEANLYRTDAMMLSVRLWGILFPLSRNAVSTRTARAKEFQKNPNYAG
ncbi:hypothetical protein TNCV_3305191 [Trichonephila clavipes]|nr:hypothetical protein TNCV_3305191 [Trichonephila clavipes]